ncbi:GNAT family N-acetyltransferase [Halopenitus sp. H-Gu1]|uniref:GNAT family N-acetyltransferase n=1 Tax=Halopenitus sp. H-Gu1 TaxID=3242697 RepID=UPI00359E7C9B
MTDHRKENSRVRPVRESDSAAVSRLQRWLDNPSPELLELGLRAERATGIGVLVSTAQENNEREASTIVGYLLFADGADDRHVAELVVAPEHRRSGRGRELLETAIAGSPGPITVLVAADNDAARSLYASCGFEARERRPNEYGERDGLLYRRDR